MEVAIGARVLYKIDDTTFCPADVVAVGDDDNDLLLFVIAPYRAEFKNHVACGTSFGQWWPMPEDDLYAHPDAVPFEPVQ